MNWQAQFGPCTVSGLYEPCRAVTCRADGRLEHPLVPTDAYNGRPRARSPHHPEHRLPPCPQRPRPTAVHPLLGRLSAASTRDGGSAQLLQSLIRLIDRGLWSLRLDCHLHSSSVPFCGVRGGGRGAEGGQPAAGEKRPPQATKGKCPRRRPCLGAGGD